MQMHLQSKRLQNMTLMNSIFGAVFIWIAFVIYRRCRRTPLSDIPGPESKSIFTGNFPELFLPDCGVTERKWQEDYGQIVRIKAAFGEDRLWIADPKAIQHVLQSSGYGYKKLVGQRIISYLLSDGGLLWAEGDVHKRQRKVMLPAFGMPESKSLIPAFRSSIENVIDKWNDHIAVESSGKFAVLDIPSWMARATLDSIGTAAFDYDFGAVEDMNNSLTRSYNNLFTKIFSAPSAMKIFWENLSSDIPISLLYFIYEILPGSGVKKLRENRAETREVAKKLYYEKQNDLRYGGGGRDIMSLLIKANSSEQEKNRLNDDEIIPQMRTIMLAGHETTSNAMTWTLYELARHPEVQNRLRAEIMEMKLKARERGDDDLTARDFDNMPYTIAVMRETLRLNPIVFRINREAVKDDILPLYTPLTTTGGKVVKEIPIQKGTRVYISIHGYHLNKEVWGPDVHEFNPERWFSPKNSDIPMVGVYGNLLSFSSGVRSCIGWRFAVIEMQTFLTSLISSFEFSVPENAKKIRRDRSGVMVPMFEGERERGVQLPLKVTPVAHSL